MQKHLPKHLTEKSIVLPEFSPRKRKQDWRGKPASWPDIRKNTEDGHIYLLVDTRYPIGFSVTATDGYSVKIDGIAYEDYNSQAQFSIADWTDYTATEGYSIDYPTGATKAHIIDIYPQTENENITAFHCARVAASGTEAQGLLWAHFNLTNQITPAFLAGRSGQYTNAIAKAITAKNNVLNVSSSINSLAFNATALEYIPVIDGDNETVNCASSFAGSGVLKITIKNFKMSATNSTALFYNSKVQDVIFNNIDTSAVSNFTNFFALATNLKKVPNGMDFSSATTMPSILQNNSSLQDTVLDVSSATGLTRLGCYGSSTTYFVGGLKGLRVSSEAPFDNATAPQINVQYTGLGRAALVQLFNDLPTVSGGQIINAVGCSGTSDLTDVDKSIATDKGWTITE